MARATLHCVYVCVWGFGSSPEPYTFALLPCVARMIQRHSDVAEVVCLFVNAVLDAVGRLLQLSPHRVMRVGVSARLRKPYGSMRGMLRALLHVCLDWTTVPCSLFWSAVGIRRCHSLLLLCLHLCVVKKGWPIASTQCARTLCQLYSCLALKG
jgi:hypothetical protein